MHERLEARNKGRDVASFGVGYCRVSTTDQAEEGVSLDAQRARILGWCAASGTPVREGAIHVDAGLSGKRADNRPGLAAAMAEVCWSPGGVLVVYSLSRLARSVRDTLDLAERLELAGADLVSLTESIDTTSAAGKMVFRLLAVLAEFERDLISERTRGAIRHKQMLNERVGQVPYGKRLAGDGRSLLDHPADVESIGIIRDRRARGWSLRRIAAELDRLACPTKSGTRHWSHSSVYDLLKRGDHAEQAADDEQGPGGPGPATPTGDRGVGPVGL
jgi:DNA invertase Pin-like site-specific DNA recombinase